MLFTSSFWKGAGERAIKTFLQSFIPALLLALGASQADAFNAWTAPWIAALQVASGVGFGAAFLSLCTSVGNADFVAGTPLVQAVSSTSDVATTTTLPAASEIGAGTVPDTSTVTVSDDTDDETDGGDDPDADAEELVDATATATA